MFSSNMNIPKKNTELKEPSAIDCLIDEAIDRLSNAARTSDFGSITNHKFTLGKKLLEELRNKEASNEEKMRQFEFIVVGAISFAMAAESSKYREFSTPLSGSELTNLVDPSYEQKVWKIEKGKMEAKHFDRDAEFANIFVEVGKKVLIDKSIPLFPDVDLFEKHGVSINAMLSLKKEAEEMLQESSPRQARK